MKDNGEIKTRLANIGEAQEMIKFYLKNFTYASIARVFGYSRERIRQICFDLQKNKEVEE